MTLRARRRWFWLLGLLGLLAVVVYGLARFTDEPLRRYMEHKVKEPLTGYTVRMRGLHVHPWTVSFDVQDATILQDANPDPARVTKTAVRGASGHYPTGDRVHHFVGSAHGARLLCSVPSTHAAGLGRGMHSCRPCGSESNGSEPSQPTG